LQSPNENQRSCHQHQWRDDRGLLWPASWLRRPDQQPAQH